jgi:hypothetical protein
MDIMIKHDKCGEFEARIVELEKTNRDLDDQAQKYYDRLQLLKEENLILMAELDDARKQLEKSLV